MLQEGINDVKNAVAPVLGQFSGMDLPVIVAGLKLTTIALERLLDQPGKDLVNIIMNDSYVVGIDPRIGGRNEDLPIQER